LKVIVRWFSRKSVKGNREGRRFFVGFIERTPERPKDPREQAARLWTNPPESREHGFSSGRKPLERRVQAGRVVREAPERRDKFERAC
jgi:hypothetical protein